MISSIELDKMRCPCGCDTSTLISTCCDSEQLYVMYNSTRKSLIFKCLCGKEVTEIKVAKDIKND